ncbi:MAG: quinone-dependent dihydroorotate dehydrogenase [Myxococcales bacterium]|nr:quinone-dependent dihydroorotate dehydrogenase [Myxococcales bacterium]
MLYPLARRLLFSLPPETAHRVTLSGLHAARAVPGGAALIGRLTRPAARPVERLGLVFDNPVGLAAGFDKDARHVAAMAGLGFGFVEVGSVTARPAGGNARPRLFRLPADGALINRMGLNNGGAAAAAARLGAMGARPVPVFVNVAKTPDPAIEGEAAIADYVAAVAAVRGVADAVVLNVSCPNSGDGRTFEEPALLGPLLDAVMAALGADGPPLLVKVSPDLSAETLRAVARLAVARGARGLSATNTTVERAGLATPAARLAAIGRGGLSGAPLHRRAVECVRLLRAAVGPSVTIVGVGGVRGPDEARAFFEAGADLVQLYTGFIYGGPGTVRRICEGL